MYSTASLSSPQKSSRSSNWLLAAAQTIRRHFERRSVERRLVALDSHLLRDVGLPVYYAALAKSERHALIMHMVH
jgi:uncharacterized protein YjiS (DUF1127 family)